MRLAQYGRQEKAIASADSGGIFERWRYGRLLLVEDDKTTAGGNLRHGVLARLIAEAAKAGVKLSEREIRYRIQCGRTYEQESQIGTARADFACWTDLRDAGFPEVPKVPGERPYDPRTTADLKSDHGRHNPLPAGWEQRELFESLSPQSTLLEAERYAAEMAELAARFSERSELRLQYFDELVKAVNGDKTRTLREAQEALEAPDEE